MNWLGILVLGLLGFLLWRHTSSPTARTVMLGFLLLMALSSYFSTGTSSEFPPLQDLPPLQELR